MFEGHDIEQVAKTLDGRENQLSSQKTECLFRAKYRDKNAMILLKE
jgi:hypothetical protein